MNSQELSSSEKILLAEELWDSVASNEQLFPVTEEQKTFLINVWPVILNQDSGDSSLNIRNHISNIK